MYYICVDNNLTGGIYNENVLQKSDYFDLIPFENL